MVARQVHEESMERFLKSNDVRAHVSSNTNNGRKNLFNLIIPDDSMGYKTCLYDMKCAYKMRSMHLMRRTVPVIHEMKEVNHEKEIQHEVINLKMENTPSKKLLGFVH